MKVEGVKGIVWDLDGTLIDSFGIFSEIVADIVEESGHTMPSYEFMLSNYHGSLDETLQNILGIKDAEELERIVASFLAKQEHHYAGNLETHLFQDAAKLAQRAAKLGIHQLLVTNRAHEGRGSASPKHIIAATFLTDCIHEVYASDEVEYRKPDKRSIKDWALNFDLNPHNILVIGDQYIDAQLALNIGARSVLIQRNGEIPHLNTLMSHENYRDITVLESLDSVELVQ